MKTIAYKVTDSNLQCRGFQYEVGKEYNHSGALVACRSGFHACLRMIDCFNYYKFDPSNRVFEVEVGEYVEENDKIVTGQIKFIREFTWEEVLKAVNTGQNNTGLGNTGNRNTGNWNTGNWNTGYSNTGDRNTGDSNTGNRNTGNRNTGNWNTGNRNTGNWNTGNRNTGNWNTGNWNTGYSNTGDRNTGVFCTGEKTMKFFDKDSSWTEQDFFNSRLYSLLCQIDTKMWVDESLMTDDEKSAFPSYKTTGGYLKDIPYKEAFGAAWDNWSEENRQVFKDLPNFDASIFELITGVKL